MSHPTTAHDIFWLLAGSFLFVASHQLQGLFSGETVVIYMIYLVIIVLFD